MRTPRLVSLCCLTLALALATVLSLGSPAWAERVTLKDGTVLEGSITRTDDGFEVKLSDGSVRTISRDDIQSIVAGDSSPKSSISPDASSGADLSGMSDDFRAARARADAVRIPQDAVDVWQRFIDDNPDSPDLLQARDQMSRWKALADAGAQNINGHWVGGADLQRILDRAATLTREADELLSRSQTLQAVQKLQEADRIYPNSFWTNFSLGNVAIIKHDFDQAVTRFRRAAQINPRSCEALNNAAVANWELHNFETAILGFQQAAQVQDNLVIAQNLYNALNLAPQQIRSLSRLKSAVDASSLLCAKYKITATTMQLGYLVPQLPGPDMPHRLPGDSNHGDEQAPPNQPGLVRQWNGTGFFISDDGLILTNRHVVRGLAADEPGPGSAKLMVAIGKDFVPAKVIAVDEDYDLAIIKIDTDKKLPFVHLAPADLPNDGADCVVLGFPMLDRLGSDVKVTRGIVSSSDGQAGGGADVMIDAKVNPGNSGGPIVDRFGNIMAIVSMKTLSNSHEDSYGVGISAGHIRLFLARHKIEVAPGQAPTASAPAPSTEDLVAKVRPATVCIIGSE